MKRIQNAFAFIFLIGFLLNVDLSAQTSLKKIDDKWTLLVQNKPFKIKGVTFGYDNDIQNFSKYFKDLKSLGVNTIRIWATNQNTLALLDAADAFDMKVMMGIWMRHGKPGMEADDSFNYLKDKNGMNDMYNNAIEVVNTYKDHPAVLMWAIGNEVYLNMGSDPEKEAYSKLLEKICSKIKEVDSNHPITSVEAWTFGLEWWEKLVPSLDIYGINCYGAGANVLPEEFKKKKVEKPYVITEYGVTGEWDSQKDKNGVIVEPDDQQKYDAISYGYKNWINNKPTCLGVYFFHYADGGSFIAPWLFTHYKNCYRPQYWAIREAYAGELPLNYPPKIKAFELPEGEIKSGTWVTTKIEIVDNEKEDLIVSFSYNQRSGSRKRRDQINDLNFKGNLKEGFEIQLPEENGPIKVYVNVKDTYNNMGIASTSIVINDKNSRNRKYLVPKVKLPFYIYKDGSDDMPYIPSGHMGNVEAIKVDLNNTEDVYKGKSSLMIEYNTIDNWYGVGFVDPPNDWGDMLGGYDLSGAKKFSFWAKSSISNIKATIGFGLIKKDKPFPDTAIKTNEIVLTTEWKKYSIKTKNLDMSCIRSGLVIFSSGSGFTHKIYLDDVVFE